jgi:hypothetical protein
MQKPTKIRCFLTYGFRVRPTPLKIPSSRNRAPPNPTSPTPIYAMTDKVSLGMVKKRGSPTRDEKLENLIMNHSMIFMGMFEEAFAAIADKMTEVMAKGTAAMAEALGGVSSGSGDTGIAEVGNKLKDEITPEVRAQIGHVFSGIREEMASQWPTNASVFKQYVASPAFDKGVKIVERYDFGRPKLTEKLSDEVLASYVFLVQSGDPKIDKMFKELAEWQSSLPKPSWAS